MYIPIPIRSNVCVRFFFRLSIKSNKRFLLKKSEHSSDQNDIKIVLFDSMCFIPFQLIYIRMVDALDHEIIEKFTQPIFMNENPYE